MAKQTVGGISGVLGGLISAPVAASAAAAPAEPPIARPTVGQFAASVPPPAHARETIVPKALAAKTSARRGRPPGRRTGSTPNKEKVTLRVDAGLIEHYREWSWSERCQLGELVERALADYRRSCA